jgi:hypothetical protein
MASTRRIEVGRRPYGATATLETRRLKRERAPVPVFFPLLSVSSVSSVVNLFCNLFNPR